AEKNAAQKKYTGDDFEGHYRLLREAAFEPMFGGYDVIMSAKTGGEDSGTDERWYSTIRMVAITEVKTQLHTGNTLLGLYASNRDAVRLSFSQLNLDQKEMIKKILTEAKLDFAEVKKGHYPDELKAYEHVMVYGDFNQRRNCDFLKKYRDAELATFAMRRHIEGGNELVDKYLTLISLLQEDLK
ncbi:MAG: hypothetical protein V4576_02080, partial [Patescibacteria group bacterium]